MSISKITNTLNKLKTATLNDPHMTNSANEHLNKILAVLEAVLEEIADLDARINDLDAS